MLEAVYAKAMAQDSLEEWSCQMGWLKALILDSNQGLGSPLIEVQKSTSLPSLLAALGPISLTPFNRPHACRDRLRYPLWVL
jgi:hypothetical protein